MFKQGLLLLSLIQNVIYLTDCTILISPDIPVNTTCSAIINGQMVSKEIGSTWTIPNAQPCRIHSCVLDDTAMVVEKTYFEYCSEMCDKGYEIVAKNDSCCGDCVQIMCEHEGNFYQRNDKWLSADNCSTLQCVATNKGLVTQIFNEVECNSIPIQSCPENKTIIRDCCPFCIEDTKNFVNQNDYIYDQDYHDNYMDPNTYLNHPCFRDCQYSHPMICNYTFNVEWYETLSKACYDCPQNKTDCFKPHCIYGDGSRKSILVVNKLMPGPAIHVCVGDTLNVDVINNLMSESTTIHWHGLHQKETPYMDGVPQITQCPILPHTEFRYTIRADRPGTHWWHSHIGMQRADGAFGALIIREPNDFHRNYYDYDIAEHVMFIQDWTHDTGTSNFNSFHHSRGNNKPQNLLINGRGRYLVSMNVEVDITLLSDDQNEIERTKRMQTDVEYLTPLEIFHVNKSQRYRFRTINSGFLNCPVEISIDKHNLTVIASDGYNFEAVTVASLVTYAGERFDFIIDANQPIGNYWIRVRGLMDCDERFTKAFQVAVLRYEGAIDEMPFGIPTYDYKTNGLQLNALNKGTGEIDTVSIAELTAIDEEDNPKMLLDNPDFKFFIYYDFYTKNNPHFNHPDFYSLHSIPNENNKFFGPQLNQISMKMPPGPFFNGGKQKIDSTKFCNDTFLEQMNINCSKSFCECTHVLQVPLNATVELILVDEGYKYDANHPFHLHGYGFRVIGMERVQPTGITIQQIKEMDRLGRMPRRLKGAPLKDTITVPDGGYTIVRFFTNNPGYWLLHCHIEFHIEVGMALVFKVGEHEQMHRTPKNFPMCYDYVPSSMIENEDNGSTVIRNKILLIVTTIIVLLFYTKYFNI